MALLPSEKLPSSSSTDRDVRLAAGRCIAALFVIYIHGTAGYIASYQSVPASVWIASDLLNSLSRVCVPWFIMISGALVLSRPMPSWSAFLKRRSVAVLKPYLFGAVFYLAWQQLSQGIHPVSAFGYLQQFLAGAAFFHLYFLFILLGMYLISPVLSGVRSLPREAIIGTTVVLFSMVAIEHASAPFGLSFGYLSLGPCYSFLPYFLSGYVLYHLIQPKGHIWLVLFIIMSLTTALIVGCVSYSTGSFAAADTFIQYTSFNVILQSIFGFCALMQIKIHRPFWQKLIVKISELTLGIYILHFAVLVSIVPLLMGFFQLSMVAQVITYPIICFLIVSLIVLVLHRVPRLRGFL